MKYKKILFIVIFIETGVLCFLIYTVYVKIKIEKNVLGALSYNNINKENLIFPPDHELKYYYESKPNVTETDQPEWLPYNAVYTLNSDGFNERFDYSLKKSPKTFRVITLGDSFTFGHFVNTADNFPEKLEDVLNTSSCTSIEKRGRGFLSRMEHGPEIRKYTLRYN